MSKVQEADSARRKRKEDVEKPLNKELTVPGTPPPDTHTHFYPGPTLSLNPHRESCSLQSLACREKQEELEGSQTENHAVALFTTVTRRWVYYGHRDTDR